MLEFSVNQNGEVLDVELKGRLDATYAPQLMDEMNQFGGSAVTKIVYHVAELEYMQVQVSASSFFPSRKLDRMRKWYWKSPARRLFPSSI